MFYWYVLCTLSSQYTSEIYFTIMPIVSTIAIQLNSVPSPLKEVFHIPHVQDKELQLMELGAPTLLVSLWSEAHTLCN